MRERLRSAAADQSGTILLLVPAGLLVMLMLGALAFDLSLSYAGERRLADLAAGWANDALAQLDQAVLYGPDQQVVLDEAAARQVVLDAWSSLDEPGLSIPSAPLVRFPDAVTIEVTIIGEVPLLFLDAVPGIQSRIVDTISVASLVVTG